MATLTVQDIVSTGLEATYAAAAGGGDEFPNNDRTFLQAVNGATDCNITITAQKTAVSVPGFGTITLANIAVLCTANEERMISAPPAIYNDGNGKAQVTYDDVTNVTVAAIQLPAA